MDWRVAGQRLLPVLIAALALTPVAAASDVSYADALVHRAAPAAPVACMATPGALGTTWFSSHDGGATWVPNRIELAPVVCLGLLLAGADQPWRNAFSLVNPRLNVPQLIGVGVLAALHESYHFGYASRSEGCAEAFALREAAAILTPLELQYAKANDAGLPPVYHEACL